VSEEPKSENTGTDIDSTDSGNASQLDSEPISQSLFDNLDRKTQIRLIACTYFAGLALGSTLAVLAFWFEYHAQTHHQQFEMRDWMVTLIFTLLSLPVVGAAWSHRNLKL
jgi:hypothetical protein